MHESIIVAILGFAGTLAGSLFGVLTAQKLTQFRIAQLEERSAGWATCWNAPSGWRGRCRNASTISKN